jgi:RimJ/RimL family protein N-acetyltransferase
MKGPPDARGDVEIGWGTNEDSRRRGYAFEATVAVIEWATSQSGVLSISATIPDTNTSSQALAHKLGMTRTSELRRDLAIVDTSSRITRRRMGGREGSSDARSPRSSLRRHKSARKLSKYLDFQA